MSGICFATKRQTEAKKHQQNSGPYPIQKGRLWSAIATWSIFDGFWSYQTARNLPILSTRNKESSIICHFSCKKLRPLQILMVTKVKFILVDYLSCHGV